MIKLLKKISLQYLNIARLEFRKIILFIYIYIYISAVKRLIVIDRLVSVLYLLLEYLC